MNAALQLFDMHQNLGWVAANWQTTTGQTSAQFNTTTWPTGLYMVVLSVDGFVVDTEQLIVY